MHIESTQSISAHHSGLSPAARQRGDEDASSRVGPASAAEPATKVTLSPEASQLLKDDQVGHEEEEGDELSADEKKQVAELKDRDAEVRAHEQAHVAASGGHTKGGIKYEFQRGPDNKQYAVGGHVEIDTTPIAGDPGKTIQKAETVRRAALAPSDPSGADRKVAAKAARTITQARAEIAAEQEDVAAEAPELQEQSSVRSSYAVAAYASVAA